MKVSILILATAMIDCQPTHPGAERPPDWAYRTIDGRQCWYQGPKMLPKGRLRWAPETPEAPEVLEPEPEPELPRVAPPDTFRSRWEPLSDIDTNGARVPEK